MMTVFSPGQTPPGLAVPRPVGLALSRSTLMVAAPLPPCTSGIAQASERMLGPLAKTAPVVVQMLSPAATSPWVPSLYMGSTPAPPMLVVSTVTLMPVEGGLAPGVTFRNSVTVPPGQTCAGLVLPTPLGGVWLGQEKVGDALLRGAADAAAKSEPLL